MGTHQHKSLAVTQAWWQQTILTQVKENQFVLLSFKTTQKQTLSSQINSIFKKGLWMCVKCDVSARARPQQTGQPQTQKAYMQCIFT